MSSGIRRGRAGVRPLLARTGLPSLLWLLAASWLGCQHGTDGYTFESNGGTSSTGASGSTAAGSASSGGGAAILVPTPLTPPVCALPDAGTAVFADRALSSDLPARRELFTWTTAEQIQEIRAGSVLMTRTEREGLGPGYAMEALAMLGSCTTGDPADADRIALAALLSGPAFSKARYAWTEPWATRVGWPGESYGDKLVRMVLRQDAWLARYDSRRLDVIDMSNAPVALADALAHPERLAGVYFVRDGGAGGPECYGSFRGEGGNGYREFIIGNEAMIEEWSLGTPEIRSRIESDIALVQTFFERIRPCPPRADSFWNSNVVCNWANPPDATEVSAYEGSLAIPGPGYLPAAEPLVSLIEALQASLFEPDPLVVTPAPPPAQPPSLPPVPTP